jgi:hypothetical protein
MSARAVLFWLVLSTSAAGPASAQQQDTPRVSLSGYVQPQFELRSNDGRTQDQALVRRAVVALGIDIATNWEGEFQADFGPLTDDSDRVTVKNTLVRYTGWQDRHGIVVALGNQKLPFSRALIVSSSRRGLVERPFTGDRAFGSPGRALSMRADGWHRDHTIFWSAAIADTRHSGEPDELRLDGVAELGDRGNEGHLVGGRVEFHPFGEARRDHGDFTHGPLRVSVGTAVYGWRSDGDSTLDPEQEVDVRRVSAIEISGGLRGGGLSVDAEFEHVSARARRPFPGDGLYALGDTYVRKGSIEAGYMLVRERFEVLGSVDALDARTYERVWHRVSGGMNWYVKRHALKFSVMHRESFNDQGVDQVRSRATYVQAQFAF